MLLNTLYHIWPYMLDHQQHWSAFFMLLHVYLRLSILGPTWKDLTNPADYILFILGKMRKLRKPSLSY